MKKTLYESLMNNISNAVSQILNEMAKDISFRDIDRKLWLSVASTCSRNKSDEAENIKPSGPDKNDAVKMMQRYVIALIVMNKPCPKTVSDIDKIKTYKLIGHRAIELGATIADIQNCYNNNASKANAKHNTHPTTVSTPAPAPVKPAAKRAPRNEFKLLDELLENVPDNEIFNFQPGYNHERKYISILKYCGPSIDAYLKKQIKKSNYDLNTFADNMRNTVLPLLKKLGELNNKEYTKIFDCQISDGNQNGMYSSKSRYIAYLLTADKSYVKTKLYGDRESFWNYDKESTFLKNIEKTERRDRNNKWHTINALAEYMTVSFFENVLTPYILYKKDAMVNANKKTSGASLTKYGMDNEPSDYWQWFCNNIKKLIDNNPGVNIPIYYGDWSGQVEYACLSDGKYYISVYMQSGNSDMGDYDYLSQLTKLRSRDTYSYRYVDKKNISWVPDPDDCIYTCTVHDLNALAAKTFSSVKEKILNGKLK